jgi:hypothetical protein
VRGVRDASILRGAMLLIIFDRCYDVTRRSGLKKKIWWFVVAVVVVSSFSSRALG